MLKDTIISAFNYDGTLLKWLKKVEDALQNASASEFRVNKKGNATISFSIVFANGDTLESGDIILQQGESVTGATIRQGHLILTLSNGDELDAGDLGAVTGFSINASQHLIVTYQNGTTQDLGAIFTGNVNINGNFTANSIIENMSGYSFTSPEKENITREVLYAGACKNGNKLTFVIFAKITRTGDVEYNFFDLGRFSIPYAIGTKLQPYNASSTFSGWLDSKQVYFSSNYNEGINLYAMCIKNSHTSISFNIYNASQLTIDKEYVVRFETTFLLSDSLAQ